MRRRYLEDAEAIALMQWARITPFRGRTVEDFLCHYPAGGKRNPREAARLKRMGVKKSHPDFFCHVAKLQTESVGPVGGLFIELKTPHELAGRKTGPTKGQTEKLELLRACGYETCVCWGWVEAATRIAAYLGVNPPRQGVS